MGPGPRLSLGWLAPPQHSHLERGERARATYIGLCHIYTHILIYDAVASSAPHARGASCKHLRERLERGERVDKSLRQ